MYDMYIGRFFTMSFLSRDHTKEFCDIELYLKRLHSEYRNIELFHIIERFSKSYTNIY
jgi:hypothetical protein